MLPVGDLGVRAAIRKAYRLEAMPTAREVEELAKDLASLLFDRSVGACWRSLDGSAQI